MKINENQFKDELTKAENPEQMADAISTEMQQFAENLQKQIINEASTYGNDSQILAQRGVRQLTADEKEYYQAFIEAAKSSNFKQALTDLDVVMPKTVITAVFDDLTRAHPLLEWVDFQNTEGAVEFIYNKGGVQIAKWGKLCDEITKELDGAFAKIDTAFHKLSAWIPVCKAMLDLGPEWLDRYVRTILSESIQNGLEEAIVNGTGNDMPIGMNRQVQDDVVVTGGVYPEKLATAFTKLDVENYAAVLAEMVKSPTVTGQARTVTEVALIVNPVDYFTKIFPATTMQTITGGYIDNVFPFPTTVIQSPYVPEGKAILAMKGRYFFGLGAGKSGKIEFSDEYRFLEDDRIYLTKLYGNGRPKDNNAFQYLDISELVPALPTIQNIDVTPAPPTEGDGGETLPPEGDGGETLPPEGDGDDTPVVPPEGDGDETQEP